MNYAKIQNYNFQTESKVPLNKKELMKSDFI